MKGDVTGKNGKGTGSVAPPAMAHMALTQPYHPQAWEQWVARNQQFASLIAASGTNAVGAIPYTVLEQTKTNALMHPDLGFRQVAGNVTQQVRQSGPLSLFAGSGINLAKLLVRVYRGPVMKEIDEAKYPNRLAENATRVGVLTLTDTIAYGAFEGRFTRVTLAKESGVPVPPLKQQIAAEGLFPTIRTQYQGSSGVACKYGINWVTFAGYKYGFEKATGRKVETLPERLGLTAAIGVVDYTCIGVDASRARLQGGQAATLRDAFRQVYGSGDWLKLYRGPAGALRAVQVGLAAGMLTAMDYWNDRIRGVADRVEGGNPPKPPSPPAPSQYIPLSSKPPVTNPTSGSWQKRAARAADPTSWQALVARGEAVQSPFL